MSHYQRTTSPLALLVSLALAGLLAIAGAGFAAPALAATSGATASSTSASAPSSFENTLFGWINRDRVARSGQGLLDVPAESLARVAGLGLICTASG